MSLLNKSSRLSKTILAIAVLLCVASIFRLYSCSTRNGPQSFLANSTAYYDESTGTLALAGLAGVPPMTAGIDDQPVIVRAVMRQDDPLTVENVRYFFRYTPEARQALLARKDPQIDRVLLNENHGKEVRLPQAGSPWVPAESAEGQKIMR